MKTLALILIAATCFAHVTFAISPPTLTAPTGISPSAVQFTWTAMAGATWYRVWVSSDAAPGSAVVDDWVENATTLSQTLAADDYTCWLQSWGPAEGYSAWSAAFPFSVGVLKSIHIPPCAFEGDSDLYSRQISASWLDPASNNQYWYAPVYLPIGAVIDSVYFYAWNIGAVPTGPSLALQRLNLNDRSSEIIASVPTTTAAGMASGSDTTISKPNVTADWAYSIEVYLASQNTDLTGAKVLYWAP